MVIILHWVLKNRNVSNVSHKQIDAREAKPHMTVKLLNLTLLVSFDGIP